MTRARAFVGFLERTMVQPDDRVPASVSPRRNRERLTEPIAHHQRAGGIETDAGDIGGISRSGLQCPAHGRADRVPDLFGIMFRKIA